MQNEIISLAKKLISYPTSRDNPQALGDILKAAKAELGNLKSKSFESKGIPSLLFYNSPTFPKKFKLILNAHLDVVPGGREQYKPKITDDKLTGRGSYDMKSAAACEILVFKELAKKVNYPLGLQLVTDEEIGGFNGAKYQFQKGVRTQCMLVGESSSDFTLGIRAKGIIWLTITFSGSSAHAAYLWNGKNAVYDANQFLNKLWKAFPIPKKEVWATTANVALLTTSNTTNNKVPGDAKINLDIRYIPGDDKEALAKIRAILPESAKMEILEYEPSLFTAEDNKYVKLFQKIAEKSLDKKIKIVGKNGGSDLRHYKGTAGLEFGPVGHGPHQDDEWVNIKSLPIYYKVLKDFILCLNP